MTREELNPILENNKWEAREGLPNNYFKKDGWGGKEINFYRNNVIAYSAKDHGEGSEIRGYLDETSYCKEDNTLIIKLMWTGEKAIIEM